MRNSVTVTITCRSCSPFRDAFTAGEVGQNRQQNIQPPDANVFEWAPVAFKVPNAACHELGRTVAVPPGRSEGAEK